MLKELIISMRPKQWYKNLIIFVGILFSLNLLNLQLWSNAVSAFIIFCMLSGSEYIINDVLDIEKDRKHPEKRKRPIASGRLDTSYAVLFATLLLIISLSWAYSINIDFLTGSVAYILLGVSYSMFLKHFVIVDVLVISLGFVIRAIAGCLAIGVVVSPWLIICTFLLALFLALGKRKHELTLLRKEAKEHRQALGGYSKEILEQMIGIVSSSLIVSYSLYTFLTGDIYMMVTIPFVIYGLFRYLFLIDTKGIGDDPGQVFNDREMLVNTLLWFVLVVLILYTKVAL